MPLNVCGFSMAVILPTLRTSAFLVEQPVLRYGSAMVAFLASSVSLSEPASLFSHGDADYSIVTEKKTHPIVDRKYNDRDVMAWAYFI
jgi:hypothetical protein